MIKKNTIKSLMFGAVLMANTGALFAESISTSVNVIIATQTHIEATLSMIAEGITIYPSLSEANFDATIPLGEAVYGDTMSASSVTMGTLDLSLYLSVSGYGYSATALKFTDDCLGVVPEAYYGVAVYDFTKVSGDIGDLYINQSGSMTLDIESIAEGGSAIALDGSIYNNAAEIIYTDSKGDVASMYLTAPDLNLELSATSISNLVGNTYYSGSAIGVTGSIYTEALNNNIDITAISYGSYAYNSTGIYDSIYITGENSSGEINIQAIATTLTIEEGETTTVYWSGNAYGVYDSIYRIFWRFRY